MNPISIFVFLALVFSFDRAEARGYVEIPQPIEKVFVPAGFDDNDNVQVMASGWFTHSCMQVGRGSAEVNEASKEISVRFYRQEYDGQKCLPTPTVFSRVFDLGTVKAGVYQIVDGTTQTKLGAITVEQAGEGGLGTDTVNYAPLFDAFFEEQNGQYRLILKGIFGDSCTHFTDIDVTQSSDTVVVLPKISRKVNEECTKKPYPFRKAVIMKNSIPKGRLFLLHVRSMGGQAINKLTSELLIDGP